jgi:hypothetical protein
MAALGLIAIKDPPWPMAPKPAESFPNQRLSFEIQLKVLEYLLILHEPGPEIDRVGQRVSEQLLYRLFVGQKGYQPAYWPRHVSVLTVSKGVLQKLGPIYYRGKVFVFERAYRVADKLRLSSPVLLANIRHIRFRHLCTETEIEVRDVDSLAALSSLEIIELGQTF